MLLCYSAVLGPWLTPILTGLAYAAALLITGAVGTGEIRNVVRELRRSR
jgi:hypothetical protein